MKSVRQIATSPRLVIAVAVILVAVLAGPFQTAGLPLASRLLFWTLLIGLNMIKWQIWVARIGARAGDSWQASAVLVLGGAILLNLTLPFEINLAYRLVGQTTRIPWAPLFTMSLMISLAVGAAIAVAHRPAAAAAPAAVMPPTVAGVTPVTAPASGLALRANIASLADIAAIVAEDHYLRLWLADGRSPLVLYRFGDAVRELAGIDGLQVHRGAWVAASAVAGAVRDGRRWRLLLAGGEACAGQRKLPARGARARRLQGVRGGEGEGLLAQHVLAGAGGGKHRAVMLGVRQGDVHRVHLRVGHEVLHVLVHPGHPETPCERLALGAGAADARGNPRPRSLQQGRCDEIARHPAGAGDAPANLARHVPHVHPPTVITGPGRRRIDRS